MAATPLKILLFALGALVAAAGTAYFAGALDPWLGTTQQVVADLPEDGEENAGKSGRLEPSSDAKVPAAEEDAAAATAKGDRVAKGDEDEQGAADVVVPTFDVVRVEPDGSLVVAGKAAPNANVEVVVGSTVVGAAASGPAGDFAVVLDDPLDPGDYQIVLRATSPEGVVATSEETAVVSVPDEESGQVLALVEQPGAPSRLITVPEAEEDVEEEVDVASADPTGEDGTGDAQASGEPVEQPDEETGQASAEGRETAKQTAEPQEQAGEDVAMADASGDAPPGNQEADTASTDSEETPSDATASAAGDEAGQDVAAAADIATAEAGMEAEAGPEQETAAAQEPAGEPEHAAEAGAADDAGAEEALTDEETRMAAVAPESDSDAQAPASGSEGEVQAEASETGDAASGQASASDEDATDDDERQMAAVAPESGSDTQAAAPEGESEDAQAEAPQAEDGQEASEPRAGNVFIEAVEIDGNQVFVAGVAEAGRRVLVYANDMLLGQAVASPDGRFLVEAIRDLPVGDYIIRADVLADNGSDVLARAAVPFEREAGEAIAAVAPRPDDGEMPSDDSTAGGQADDAPEAGSAGEEPTATDETEMASAEEPPQAQTENGSTEMAAEEGLATSADEPGDAVASAGEEAPASDENRKADAEKAPKPADGTAMADMSEDDASGAEDIAASQESDASMPDDGAQVAGEAGSTVAGDTGGAEESGEAGSMAASDEEQEAEVAAASEAAETMRPTSEDAQSGDEPVVTAPKLESAEGAVIIRRGDTLWHISRRVYGRGIRYTTIYLANDDQIRDPHWIWPGQVFRVPEKTEEGETAEMDALGDQLVPVPQEQ